VWTDNRPDFTQQLVQHFLVTVLHLHSTGHRRTTTGLRTNTFDGEIDGDTSRFFEL
jgi:hypothetical protein